MLYVEYSVYVGGGEVNDYPLSACDAEQLAIQYKNNGYTDVAVVAINKDATAKETTEGTK